ncbi:glycosyltransferase family 1 protein [Arthrobacter sp. Marseille-P9274]|uniref:glycosyltransferase family 4 protein n=1 Tax=Arthrobacter sp. Marseille-P9274 TaxID=2866572 RepID=UPI0021C86E40|nr:glycosyltransferase family 1 protein [Arthrobacter sp. Marseille-P9274]
MKIFMPSRILDRHVGGNTTYARRLAEGLIEAGHSIARIPAANKFRPMTMAYETAVGLSKGQPEEILHFVADTGPLLPTRRPSVVTVHGVASRWISTARSSIADRAWRARVTRAIRSTDHVLTVSQSSADDVSEVFGISQQNLTVIPHGIDVEKFSTPTPLSDELRAKLPDQFVLYLGNIEPRKNLLSLVRAFETPEIQSLNLPLVIAGKQAWDYQDTMAAIEAAPNVIHLGFVSDQERTALMQNCSLFVFPSLYEGFGFPVLEALAAGAVVAASSRGSLAEVAGPSIGLEELTVEGLAAGLEAALNDQQRREVCLRQGRRWAQRFSWDESVSSHIRAYERVMNL